ncbi:hypothetical protein EKD00_08390, partial [Chlorobium phaeovibrioides]|uniref:glutaredoxin family protein n=1 Tax=Chlorobium phaeovibrioides TaxID=1094 RepID=UPI000FC197C1
MNCPVPQVTIYGKPGCCLCDEALEVMSRIQVRVKCSPKIGQLVKLAKTLKPSSQHEAE